MREIDDCRKKASEYELTTHLIACLAMFLFKTESRNGYNNNREDLRFRANYKKVFKCSMPHGDSVHRVIAHLNGEQLEMLNQRMVRVLLERKVFHNSRYRNQWFRVAVDASGAVSFNHKHCDQCLHKTSQRGKINYSHGVLDARLVTPNGFSISLACQWLENPISGVYDKQDCELKAFKRLAVKLKKAFPRLPIIILADGLYPNEGVLNICKTNRWAWQITLQEGSLPSVWTEVYGLEILQADNRHTKISYLPDGKKVVQVFRWVTEIDYKGHCLNWMECCEKETWIEKKSADIAQKKSKETRFVYITNLPLEKSNIVRACQTGRMRWKIENEGFNILKNGGYKMKHKYARTSYQGLKNYFQFMQMGYLINQLMVKNIVFHETYLQGKNHPTLKSLWATLISAMRWAELDCEKLLEIATTRIQFRFVS